MASRCFACGHEFKPGETVPAGNCAGCDRLRQALRKLIEAEECPPCADDGCSGCEGLSSACPCGGACHVNIERAKAEAKTALKF